MNLLHIIYGLLHSAFELFSVDNGDIIYWLFYCLQLLSVYLFFKFLYGFNANLVVSSSSASRFQEDMYKFLGYI